MSDQPLPGPASRAASRQHARVEYLDFRNVEEHREYRFRAYGPDGSIELRSRIAQAAFDARLVRVSDGPDLCYQKLLRAIAAGETVCPDVIVTIGEADFSGYLVEHTPVPKRRSSWKPRDPAPVAERPQRPQYRATPARRVTVQAPPAPIVEQPGLGEGQRVKHARFGMGVTGATDSTHTVICFDQDGPKRFVTAMLDVEVLSAPHTWQTGPRGVNRAR